MIQIAADKKDGYLINADREAMLTILDGIDHALDGEVWEAICLGPNGVTPLRIKVSDEPELAS